jgi:hypothetical protein
LKLATIFDSKTVVSKKVPHLKKVKSGPSILAYFTTNESKSLIRKVVGENLESDLFSSQNLF